MVGAATPLSTPFRNRDLTTANLRASLRASSRAGSKASRQPFHRAQWCQGLDLVHYLLRTDVQPEPWARYIDTAAADRPRSRLGPVEPVCAPQPPPAHYAGCLSAAHCCLRYLCRLPSSPGCPFSSAAGRVARPLSGAGCCSSPSGDPSRDRCPSSARQRPPSSG